MDLGAVGGIMASVCSFALAIIIILYTDRKFRRFDALADNVSNLLRYEEDAEGNVLLDARIGKMIGALSAGMAKSFKMSMLQGLSVNAKLEKGLKGAIAQDVVDNKMPILNLIGDVMGFNTKQWIAKHPEALGQLAPMLGKFMGGLGGAHPRNNPGQGVM